MRRNRREPEQQAYSFVFAPKGATLAELAGAAGLRWTVVECFQRAKDQLGLYRRRLASTNGFLLTDRQTE